jgi:hypothetical protein
MKSRLLFVVSLTAVAAILFAATVGTTLTDFFLPGSQPNQSGTFTASCSCHDGYNISIEPGFNWRGSMMAQAMRDPLYLATLTIANQDADFVGDLCIRCHSPIGWLEGRSLPTDGSSLIAKDREGVSCEFCHRSLKSFPRGVNPYPGDTNYTTVPSGYTSPSTFIQDTTYLATVSPRPPVSGGGMYVVDSDVTRRGPRPNANPAHGLRYSPFHRDAAICGTCHDVSNPAFSRNYDQAGNSYYTLNTLNTAAPSFNTYDLFPVERTYSEWLNSAYNTPQGVYAPQFGGNKQYVSTCQDCHMRDVTGKAAQQGNVQTWNDLALHDMTGGNTWVPKIIRTFFPSEVTQAVLDSGISRARRMLRLAATLNVRGVLPDVIVSITNETGHKLPSGYPEGRRMWINVKAYDIGKNLIAEFGAYDSSTAVLTTTNTKVYEVKLAMSPEVESATGKSNMADGSSFHFVLNNMVVKDNRIPPRGFTNDAFKAIQSPPVAYSYADGQYWDLTRYTLPAGTAYCIVSVYYQTTSKEYIEFLKNENVMNNWGTNLYNAWATSGKSTPELMASFGTLANPIPVVSAAQVLVSSGGLVPGTANNPILAFHMSATQSGRSFDTVKVQMMGTYTQSDVQKFKLWASTDATFNSATDLLLSEKVPAAGGGETIVFHGFTESISTSLRYYFVTVDISSGANPASTINAKLNALSDIAFNSLVASSQSNVFPIVGEEKALPVQFVSMQAKVDRFVVTLEWTTATETDNNGFDVERRVGTGQWNRVGFVQGSGTSMSPRRYVFSDRVEQLGRYAYRLRQINSDATFTHSPEIEVMVGHADRRFALYSPFPNPANPSATVEFVMDEPGHATVRVYNTLGQVVAILADGDFPAAEVQRLRFDGSHLPSGIYYCELLAGSKRAIQKFVLMK